MHKFIYDVEQVMRFHSLLHPLKEDEAYFVALGVRTKNITKEERKSLNITDKMLGRKLVKRGDFETYLRVLKTFEIPEDGYTSITNKILPAKILAIYGNVNASSGKLAYANFNAEVTQLLIEGKGKRFSGLDSILMTAYQTKCVVTRKLIDIDCDVPTEGKDLVSRFVTELKEHGTEVYVIKTKGGFHVLIDKNTLKYNYNESIAKYDKEVKERFGHAEVKYNKDGAVPVPGTIQCGYEVKFEEV